MGKTGAPILCVDSKIAMMSGLRTEDQCSRNKECEMIDALALLITAMKKGRPFVIARERTSELTGFSEREIEEFVSDRGELLWKRWTTE